MNINEVLYKKLEQYVMKGNEHPTAMYLGSREDRALSMEMAKYDTVPMQIAGYPPRPKWEGISVYRVNDEHHIAFA